MIIPQQQHQDVITQLFSYGCGRRIAGVTISNQYLDCILAYKFKEGSFFVTRTFTYTYGFKQVFIRLDI